MNKKQLKIAVFHNLPSGGAKRSLYTYIQYLTQQGHIVDVFIPSSFLIFFVKTTMILYLGGLELLNNCSRKIAVFIQYIRTTPNHTVWNVFRLVSDA